MSFDFSILTFIILLFAFAAGVIVGYIVMKSRVKDVEKRHSIGIKELTAKARSDLDEALERAERLHKDEMERGERYYAESLRRVEESYRETIEREKVNSKESLEVLQSRFDETIAKMESEVKNSTSEMLKLRQEEFSKTSRDAVGTMLEPLEKTIVEMRRAVAENTSKHDEFGGRLAESLRIVMQHSDAARKSADKLADALRGGGRIQGDWGETVLTELLTSQGLTEGVHYETQFVMRDANGNVMRSEENKTMRPDVVLHLDNERDVIIDAKVSLSAFLDYMNAETEESRTKAMRDHVASLEKHVQELIRKDYSSFIESPRVSVGYVIMFVPNTAALYAATNVKPELWRKAMEKGVYIADEQTLYAALKIIDMTWRQITQAENHQKVYQLAGEMLDRVGAFMTEYTKIGNEIDSARKAYEGGLKKLQDSGQSIPQTCGKLLKLGARHTKQHKGVARELLGFGEEKQIE